MARFKVFRSLPAAGTGCEEDPNLEDSMAQRGTGWQTDYRIPSDTRAVHYDLYLHPNLDGDDFKGSVTIDVAADERRDFFVVHVKYLTVTKTELRNSDGKLVRTKNPSVFR